MKAMLLAAGRGERMRPLSDRLPKPLLPVGGKALMVHLIERLVANDFRELVVNHSWQGERIVEVLGDGRSFGARIQYSDEGDTALETGGGILRALPLLGGGPFLAVNADIWTDFPFASLRERPLDLAHLVLVDNPEHHPRGDFGLVDGRVEDGGEQRLTFGGIGVYRGELFAGQKGDRFPLGPLLRETCRTGRISGEHYGGTWMDVGTPERLQALQERLSGSD